jgi:hypothetical protein
MTGKTGYKWKTVDTWNLHVTRDCCNAFVKCDESFDIAGILHERSGDIIHGKTCVT